MSDGGGSVTELTPRLSAEEQAALKDVWAVYERHYDEIQEATLAAAEADPHLRALLAEQRAGQHRSDPAASRRLLREALQEGRWEGLLESLREQGGYYARLGLPFSSWFVVVTAAQRVLLNRLFETHAADPPRLLAAITALGIFLFDVTLAAIGDEYLRTRESVIEQQQAAIQELSTPVLPLRPGLIILPIIGTIDTGRARHLTEHLLEGIRAYRAKVVVMDLTGVPAVDSAVANHLLQTVRAARLLGARTVVTGISTQNAQTLTRIGVDLSGLITTADLQGGIEEAEWLLSSLRAERGATAVDATGSAAPRGD